ncbi:MAG: hypothetical protein QXJ68_03115 [Methanocellales archaeon]
MNKVNKSETLDEVYLKIKRLKRAFKGFKTYEAILDSILIFMIVYIILLFLKMDARFAIGFAAAYFIFRLIKYFKFDIILEVVRRYPKLNERLQTAYDNIGIESLIARDLSQQVSRDMDKIRYSSFFPARNIFKKVLAIVCMAFIMISLTFAHVDQVVEETIGKILPPDNEGTQVNQVEKQLNKTRGNRTRISIPGEDTGESNIWGEASIAKIEGENVDFKIYRGVSSELGMRRAETELPEYGASEQFPVSVIASLGYEENYSKVYEEVIKNYFNNLSKLGV